MSSTYSRSEIRSNRQRWIDYLKQPDTKKAINVLDNGKGRCCLGHACYVMEIPSVSEGRVITSQGVMEVILYDGIASIAPDSLVEKVGLYNNIGETMTGAWIAPYSRASLAAINDDTDATPQEIGAYLESVIEGGSETPFKPLEEYPE